MSREFSQNNAAVLERGIDVLLTIKNTPVATVDVIQEQVLPSLSKRSVQRYLVNLQNIGLVRRVGSSNGGYRYYLSGAAEELFGGTA